ncbi:MAG: hypothetical protein N2746_10115 [Deltaproteobacteria bacterium]|nr:hypothetical protein [Deltaproteobacteria bacterium]
MSRFQRYFSNNNLGVVALLIVILSLMSFSPELSLISFVGLILVLLIRRRRSTYDMSSLLSIIERKSIDNQTSIILIEYAGYRYLLLLSKNYAIKINEERRDV